MSVRKSSHGTIFLIVSSGSTRALIASSLRSTSKKPGCPMTRSLHPPMTAHGHRVRFVATWREEFFEVPSWPIIPSQRVAPKTHPRCAPTLPEERYGLKRADKRRSPEMATSRRSSIAQRQRLKKPRATVRPIDQYRFTVVYWLVGWSELVSLFRRGSQPRHRRKNRVSGQRQQKLAGESLLAGADRGGGDC